MAAPSAEALVAAGQHCHGAGRLDEAEAFYRAALRLDPCHAGGLHLLGVIHYQRGALEEAVASIRQAIAIEPCQPAAYINLSNALLSLHRHEEAAAECRAAIRLRPDFAEAHGTLGMALHEQGRLPEALDSLRTAVSLNPDYAIAHNNLGNVLRELERIEEAVACYQEAVRLNADFAEAHANLGSLLISAAPDQAMLHLEAATRLQPGNATTHYELGRLFARAGRQADAAAQLRRAIENRPGYVEASIELGNAYLRQTMPEEALKVCTAALPFAPESAALHNNIAMALLEMDRPEDANDHFTEAMRLNPDLPGVQSNAGIALQNLGRLEEARAAYRRAIAISADYADAHMNLGMTLLALGKMEEGWKEYEWRWRSMLHGAVNKTFEKPQWNGEPAEGRTILLHVEQGFGDTLQFCRYAPLVAARGFKVVMAVQAQVARLLQGMPGVDRIIMPGEALPHVDLQCPLLSLPMAMGTTLATIPAATPYLHADPALTTLWGQRLAAAAPRRRLRVGLVWQGGSHGHSRWELAANRRRSVLPALLAPLFAADADFVSLQKGGDAMPPHLPLIDLMDDVTDFADTAALIANLDLVIAVDTATLHLAAGMGKPVWMLDRHVHCWRWLPGRTDSPWYPSLRIYRQESRGEWGPVIAAVAADLRGAAPPPAEGRRPLETLIY